MNSNFNTLGVDYIVEQGTSGSWYYRKWNSGIAECWGDHETTILGNHYENNLYLGHGNLSFPFTFINVPAVTYSCYITNSYDWSGKSIVSHDNFNFYVISIASFTTGSSAIIKAYAIGNWK